MHNLDRWMGIYIPDDTPVHQVILPGTHNSGAYKVNVDINLPKTDVPNSLFDVGMKIGEWIIEDWTCTQKLSIKKQLDSGVRALDLRVARHQGEFMICHNFACIPLKRALLHVKRFAEAHPTEIIYIRISKDYANRETMTKTRHDEKLFDMLNVHLGNYLFPRRNYLDITVGEMREKGKTVIVNYDEPHISNSLIWALAVENVREWPSTLKEKKKLLKRLVSSLPPNDGYSTNRLEMTLTPDAEMIKDDVLNPFDDHDSLLGLTKKIREVMFGWMDKMDLKNFNIVEVDFVRPDFVWYIIGKNKR